MSFIIIYSPKAPSLTTIRVPSTQPALSHLGPFLFGHLLNVLEQVLLKLLRAERAVDAVQRVSQGGEGLPAT
jgi:hypothetical protein